MLTRKALPLSLLLPLAAGAAMAGPGRFPPSYDLNGDGKITREEVQTARATEFQQIDQDQNGYATIAEVQAWLDQKASAEFAKLDADQSGSLSLAEYVGTRKGRQLRMATKEFRFNDSDGDGALGLAEFKAIRPVARELTHLFAHLDQDDDDQISQAEYLTPPRPPQGRGPAGGPDGQQGGPGGGAGGGERGQGPGR